MVLNENASKAHRLIGFSFPSKRTGAVAPMKQTLTEELD